MTAIIRPDRANAVHWIDPAVRYAKPAGTAVFLGRVRRRLEEFGSPALTATFVGCLTVGLVGWKA